MATKDHASAAATRTNDISTPEDLDVRRFTVGSDDYAVFSFPVRDSAQCLASSVELTPSEREVLGYLIEGRSNAEIALARGTSPRTIAKQVVAIYRKLGIGSRRELRARQPR